MSIGLSFIDIEEFMFVNAYIRYISSHWAWRNRLYSQKIYSWGMKMLWFSLCLGVDISRWSSYRCVVQLSKDIYLNMYLLCQATCTSWSSVSVDVQIIKRFSSLCFDYSEKVFYDKISRPVFALITLSLTTRWFWGGHIFKSISVLLC